MTWTGFGDLDLGKVEAENGRTTLKPGSYTCRITAAEVKETKNKGHALKVELTDVSGAGKVEDFINIHNANAQAQEIGLRRLKGLLVASGHPNPDKPGDVKSLIGKVVGVHVEQSENWVDGEGKERPGGGKPRGSGAYYKVSEGSGASEWGTGAFTSPTGTSGGRDLDDEIPF